MRRLVRLLSPLILMTAIAPSATAGRYPFALSTPQALDAAFQPATLFQSKRLDADRVVVASGAHAGLQIRVRAGGAHDANALAYLVAHAPAGAAIVRDTIVTTLWACTAVGASNWFTITGLGNDSEFEELLRSDLPSAGTCARPPAAGSVTSTRMTNVRLYLGNRTASTGQAAGTSVTLEALSGEIDDPMPPSAELSLRPRPVGDRRVVLAWSAHDGQSGPRHAFARVDGGPLVPLATGATSTPAPGCLAGQWLPGCATSATGEATVDLPAVAGLHTIEFVVEDGVGNRASAAATATLVLPPANLTAPAIGGRPQVGQTLTVTPGTWSNEPTTLTTRFERITADGIVSLGEGDSAVLGRADVGATIRVTVTAANVAGTTSASSVAVGPVLPAPPTVVRAPAAPVASVGAALVADTGEWDNGGQAGDPARSVRWLRCDDAGGTCAPIALGDRYAVVEADRDRTLRIVVTAANDGGETVATSAASLPVGGAAAPAIGIETIVSRRRVRAGGSVTVAGVVATGGRPYPSTVTVAIVPSLAAYTVTRTVPVGADGRFSAVVRPRLSGRVRVSSAATAELPPIAAAAGSLVVAPLLVARFSARPDVAGRLRDLRVAGRVRPGIPLRGRLVLEGRDARGRVVGAFCLVERWPRIGRGGRLQGSCPARGLAPQNTYRVRFVPAAGAPLAAAVSRWVRATVRG